MEHKRSLVSSRIVLVRSLFAFPRNPILGSLYVYSLCREPLGASGVYS
jgi:hypothetical protein